MKKSKLGFTIVEVSVAALIMSIIGFAAFKLLSHARATSARAECRSALRLSIQTAARQIERDISSSRVLADKANKKFTMTLEGHNEVTGGTVAEMEAPIPSAKLDESESNKVAYFDSNEESEKALFEKVTYTLSGGVLKRSGEKSGTLKIGDKIKSVNIPDTANYDGQIEVTIVAAAKPDGEKEEVEYQEKLVVSIRGMQHKIVNPEDDRNFKRRVGKSDY